MRDRRKSQTSTKERTGHRDSTSAPDIGVIIAEDDQYSCDLMALLLTRDWRTRVVAGGVDSLQKLEFGDSTILDADLVLLDTEIPGDAEWPFALMRKMHRRSGGITFVCTGTAADEGVLQKALAANARGYIIKDEVHYALGETLVRAVAGTWVSTPSVANLIRQKRVVVPHPHLTINGTRPLDRLTARELEIARLGILFNQSYKDLGDELGLSAGHVGDLVSGFYAKLGLTAILEGRSTPESYFDDPEILALFHAAIARRKQNPKATAGIKTLAFHLLTLPEIIKQSS